MPKIVKQSVKKVFNPSNILDGIVRVDELEDTGYKFLIYGLSGTGKTTLGSTFPKPLLIVRPERAEDGTRSVRNIKGIDVTPYLSSPNQLDEIVEYQTQGGKYKTILLDGVTKFQDLVLKKILNLSDVPEQLSWGIANQQTWGIVSNELKEHLRKLLRLTEMGTHIVIVGGERSLNTGEDNPSVLLAPTVMVALTPSSMGWMHEVMDYNVRTFIRRKTEKKIVTIAGKKKEKEVVGNGIEYCVQVRSDPTYQIKFRVPKGTELPECVADPTFEKLDQLIKGGK